MLPRRGLESVYFELLTHCRVNLVCKERGQLLINLSWNVSTAQHCPVMLTVKISFSFFMVPLPILYFTLLAGFCFVLLDSMDFCPLSPILLEGLNITMRLEGNPWTCDCSLSYLRGLQIRMEVRLSKLLVKQSHTIKAVMMRY